MFGIFKYIDTNYLFLLSAFPIIGLLISYYLNKKTSINILIISTIFLAFILTGYYILTSWVYVVCFLNIFSVVFANIIGFSRKKYKIAISISLFILLFLLSYIIHWIDAFGGNEFIEYTYRENNYKIERTLSQGFSGKAVTRYKLYKSPLWGIVYKNIETIRIDPFEPSKECILKFNEAGVIFNRCSHKIETVN